MTDEVMLSGRVPEELKRLVDADPRPNQEVMRAALWREFGGERVGALERQMREKENRMDMLTNEIQERGSELQKLRQDLEALESKREQVEEKQDREEAELERARQDLADVERDPSNPAIKSRAAELDMTPTELLDELPDTGNDDDLRSL